MTPITQVVSLHGIHDDGDQGIDRVGRGVASRLDVPHAAPKLMRRWALMDYFASTVKTDAAEVHWGPDSLVLTHSRGGYLAWTKLHHLYARFVVMFAPALPADADFSRCKFERLWVIHNRHDRALKWSRYLPWHPYAGLFGKSLGRDGYTGSDPRVMNVPAHDDRSFLDHSEYWATPALRQKWCDVVAGMVRNA